MPNSPLKPAGMRIEPPPSPPDAIGTSPPATAAAEPPDEPPGGAGRVPRVAGDAVQRGDADVEAAELAMPWSGRRGRRPPARSRVTMRRVAIGDAVREHERRLGVGPALDRVELLHADRHAAEREVDVGRAPRVRVRASMSRCVNALSSLASMAAREASSSSTGERSPDRNASTSEQASPNHGVSGMRVQVRRSGGARLLSVGSTSMDARQFLGLEPTHNPHRWVLPVDARASAPAAASCSAGAGWRRPSRARGHDGRPVVWATAQYLSYARPPTMMDVDVTIAAEGHQITQARAVAHVVDREILTVNAALGAASARCERPVGGDADGRHRPTTARRGATAIRARTRSCSASTCGWPTAATSATSTARPAPAGRRCGCACRRCSTCRRPRSRSSATTCRSGSARRSGRWPAATASTTRCGSRGSCRPSGCCSTSGCTRSRTASATGSCTCGPRTARCSRTASQSSIVRFWSPEVEASIRAEMGGKRRPTRR